MDSDARSPRRAPRALALFALIATFATLIAGSTFTVPDEGDDVIAGGGDSTRPPHHPGPATPHPVLAHGADGARADTATTTPPVEPPPTAPIPPAPVATPPPTTRPAPSTMPSPEPAPPPIDELPPAPAPVPPGPPDGRVPCDLTPAAESCWAAHTGVPGWSGAQIVAGQSPLEHIVGDVTVTVPGTVIDSKWIDGCISIEADAVTIRNTLVRTRRPCYGGNGQAAGSAINIGNAQRNVPGVVGGLVITDVEVDAMNAPGDYAGIGAQGYTCIRCNVHGATKNLWANDDVTIRDSYIHHPSTANGSIHSESVNADSGERITIDHSFVTATGTGAVTGAVAFLASWGPGRDVTINDSYLEGGSGADLATAAVNTHIRVTGNAFSTVNGYGGTTFVYGFNRANPGMVWAGNRVAQTGAELPVPDSP